MIVVNPTGGGLSNGKLAQATATPADVLSGKTFFAGGKDIETGTFNLAAANATAAQVLNGYKFYAGDKELKTGTLIPTPNVKTGTFEGSGYPTIECGFRPICVILKNANFGRENFFSVYCYDGTSTGFLYMIGGSTLRWTLNNDSSFIQLRSTGFYVYRGSSGQTMPSETIEYIAIG